MNRFWQHVKSGDWLTLERVRGYSLILLILAGLAMAGWIMLSKGGVDPNGKPLGTDFLSFYAAGSLVLDGRTAEVYDMAAHYARQQKIFGAAIPYYGWLYPPIFLLIATPLALLPYAAALALWQIATLLAFLGLIGWIVRPIRIAHPEFRHTWLWVALAFPAVFINLGHGQNGFLTAALLGAALMTLPMRPVLAGVLFGLLAYKPQFALVIPVALLAAGQWRAIVSATVTVLVLVGSTAWLFGIEVWFAFARSTAVSRKLLLEQGDVGFEKLQSVFAAIRLWGGSIPLAYTLQTAISILTVCGVVWVWRSRLEVSQKAAVLVIATLLASPHVLDYDLTLLAPALAFIAVTGLRRGFRPYEVSMMAVAWAVPLFSRGIAGLTGIPLGLMAVTALYVVTLRRAAHDMHEMERRPVRYSALTPV
ncbi:MAG: DUF2029 domain-containing protein [Bradyrhizobiaceae bacterium]|nr:MAG: DUF2029 domain-containing protein [Bradyrhizobiaceae bacterium]